MSFTCFVLTLEHKQFRPRGFNKEKGLNSVDLCENVAEAGAYSGFHPEGGEAQKQISPLCGFALPPPFCVQFNFSFKQAFFGLLRGYQYYFPRRE